jgi:hypothetical protein
MKSAEESSQFRALPDRIREIIMKDAGENGIASPTLSFTKSAEVPMAVQGAMYKDDMPSYQGTVGPLSRKDVADTVGAPSTPQPTGALSSVAQRSPMFNREEPDIAAMLAKFVPDDDSTSKYIAMAQALGRPTASGSFGEKMANVADALNEQKQNQQKLRAQYTPLIMQHVAAQQAREEQAAYRLEAQQQAQQAQLLRDKEQNEWRAEQASAAQRSADERSKADRKSREFMAANAADLRRDLAPSRDGQKPLPPGALKMQQDALDAIGVSSSINSDLGAIEKQIESGKLKFGPISNLINKGMNATGNSSEESRNFGSFTSTLERLRNESLRLNTGVQTDGDAQRAWNELFQNINDTDLVKQRLTEIRNINKRGAELQQLKIDGVRANYGHGPMDTSAQREVPAALNTAPAQSDNGGWAIKLKGQ